MPTRTRFVFLMHPKEYKQEKAGTGRLTHLALAESEIHMGVGFDADPAVQSILRDATLYPVLLYPGPTAANLSNSELDAGSLAGRRLVIFLLDATWSAARKMLRLSPSLQGLPRVMFTPTAPSRYVIKQQPHPACLSTLEATHELLLSLERTGLDSYPDPDQLLGIFARMQNYQIACALDPNRGGYRRRAYSDPAARGSPEGRSGRRRTKLFGSDAMVIGQQDARPGLDGVVRPPVPNSS